MRTYIHIQVDPVQLDETDLEESGRIGCLSFQVVPVQLDETDLEESGRIGCLSFLWLLGVRTTRYHSPTTQ